jgi:diphthine-ammonia ligase
MCGIIGVFHHSNPGEILKQGLSVMKNRGQDGCGIATATATNYVVDISALPNVSSKHAIGHLLHSVVSKVHQPLKKKGILSINCEIYNWKKLKEKYHLQSKNDAELVLDLIEKQGVENLKKTLDELDGVYAFAYWYDDEVYIARDLLGIKPVWYSETFAFASERKALHAMGYMDCEELNPRHILIYDSRKKTIKKQQRSFFSIKESKLSTEKIQAKTKELLDEAIMKRLPDEKFGLLFSGGIDSTFLAHAFKQAGRDFICYTAALEEEGMGVAQDLIVAQKLAKEMNLTLKVKKLNLTQVKSYLKTVVPLIEDTNVVKVGVALTFYAASELAYKDGVKVMFSGLGSEEIFAGYERHKLSQDINKECLSGLLKIYERDLYRDDVVTMNNKVELRLPFLDKALVKHSLSIPASLKLDGERNKIILRDIAKEKGIPTEYTERKKKAAQYGSKFDRALQRLAKKDGFAKKSEYLKQFYQPPNVKLGVLWSGGKDSAYAAWTMMKQNYEVSCLISLKSKNDDSYMFHTPNIDLVDLQAEAMQKPLIVQETRGEKEKELLDLKKAIVRAKKEYAIQGIITGALYSNYQRERIEKICDELELKIFSPLWHIDQELEMRNLMKEGFTLLFSSVAAYGLDKSWLGKEITDTDVDKLVTLKEKYKINVAGEGGEFESLILDAPFFTKKLVVKKSESYFDKDGQGRFLVQKAVLVKK